MLKVTWHEQNLFLVLKTPEASLSLAPFEERWTAMLLHQKLKYKNYSCVITLLQCETL